MVCIMVRVILRPVFDFRRLLALFCTNAVHGTPGESSRC